MNNDATMSFDAFRPYLMGVAYRMLGTWSDAEDAVQGAWLRGWERAAAGGVEQPRAWWTRVVVRECLDARERSARARETYVGPWLPEPLGPLAFAPLWDATRTPAEQQTLRLGMLRLMQSLTPLELAAFLLRDVFDDDYGAIAQVLERDEAAVRQLVRRARQHLSSAPTRFVVDRPTHESMLQAFAQAAAIGDLDAIRRLLHTHCTARTDGGGTVSAATRPITGAHNVARFYVGLARLMARNGDVVDMRMIDANGLPGLGFFAEDGSCETVLQLVLGVGGDGEGGDGGEGGALVWEVLGVRGGKVGVG
jgi:RNA polymerase sigma-70 factor (ECF subfamily)